MKRHFLLLQGVCSPFFAQLGDALQAAGHAVSKINFNAGDVAYWGRRPATAFREPVDMLSAFLGKKYAAAGITDQIVFGDCRPVHAPAIALARSLGIRNHVYEEGYFRPHWITLEREGSNAHSLLPRDAGWFMRVGKTLPRAHGDGFAAPFWKRAAHDVAYHAAGMANPLLFPHYRTHAPVRADREYRAYVARFMRLRRRAADDAACVAQHVAAAETGTPYFLLPLQLDGDAQIRVHSAFANMAALLDYVLASFAQAAPPAARLLVKNHPLDPGLCDYAYWLAQAVARYGLTGRVAYIESGDLPRLLRHAAGLVTVNSTVGSAALAAHCPIFALGEPIYQLPGLTTAGTLDAFWGAPQMPDRVLFRHFRNIVIHTTQINGGFYSREGIQLAVANSLPVLTAAHSPLEQLL